MSVTGRVGSAASCQTAASHRASALRLNGSVVLRVASTASRACAGVRQVAQFAPQDGGPRPRPQQIHHPAPQRGRREPKSGPAADRGGDDPDAVRLAQRLVDDRPVVRADQETRLGDNSAALADRGLPDGVAEDHRRHGRPGRSDPLSDPGDTTPREPHPLDEAARLTAHPARHVLEHGSTVLNPPVRRLHDKELATITTSTALPEA